MLGKISDVFPHHRISLSQQDGIDDDEQAITDEFEEAIQRSVTATSRGDPHEDSRIERAIRASVRELRRAQHAAKPDISAPVSRVHSTNLPEQETGVTHGLQQVHLSRSEEDLQAAIEASKHQPVNQPDEELQKAIEESKREHEEAQRHVPVSGDARTEEEIVLDYVKKQSLAEAQHKQDASTS